MQTRKPIAATTGFPSKVWLGKRDNEPDLFAFANEARARLWAANGAPSGTTGSPVRRVIGPIEIEPFMQARTAQTVPVSAEWTVEED